MNRAQSVCILIDMQEKLLAHMHDHDNLVDAAVKLVKGLNILEVPLLWNEQYPRGLGPTTEPIARLLEGSSPMEKKSFSCCGSPDFMKALEQTHAGHVILFGIEAHVCVYQTARDLLQRGYTVDIPADCVSSRTAFNKETALNRLRDLGAGIVTMEMVLFDLLQEARGDRFKAVSGIVK